MAVNTLTLYMPGSSVGIQVYEGSQLHLILVSQGANSIPSAPGQTVRQDPFPQYVDDDELAAALAGVGSGGGYSDMQAVAAVQNATTVTPSGAWDFAQAPTVTGVPVGSGVPQRRWDPNTGIWSDRPNVSSGTVVESHSELYPAAPPPPGSQLGDIWAMHPSSPYWPA